MSVQDRIPANGAAAAGRGIHQRLDRILVLLERLRGTGSRAAGEDAGRARLADAAQLVDVLQSITPELQHAARAGGWDGCDAITARVVFEIYNRAVRELRAVAVEARGRIERAQTVLAEAGEFARRRRRRVKKISAKYSSDRRARSDT